MPVSQQSGFTFPMIKKGPQGRVNYAHNDSQDLIQDSILQIILTTPGERMWNPTFGCRVRKKQFDPSSTGTVATIQNLIAEAIQKWETRVTITAPSITVTFANDNSGSTVVTIPYSVNNPDFTGSRTDSITVTL